MQSKSPFLVVFLIALVFSFFCFATNPASWFDEGIYFQVVNNIASSGTWGIETAPQVSSDLSLISVGYPAFLPAALAFKIFGANIVVLRLVAISFLLGLVLLFYFLSRKLYGLKLAFFSSLLLVTFSPLYGNGKNFLGEVPGLFFFLAGLLFLLKFEGEETERQYLWAFLAGIFLGLAAAAKPIFLLILPALGLAWLWNFRKNFLERAGLFKTLVFGVGVLLPLFFWVFTQFGFETSAGQIWAHYSNPYYVENFLPLILANLKRFISETTPLHFLILLALALWFLGRKLKRGEPISSPEITAFVFSFLVFLAYLRTTGWYRNFFPGHVILFLFFAPGLKALAESFSSAKGGSASGGKERAMRVFYVAVSAAVLIQLFPLAKENLWCRLDAPTALEPYLANLPKTEKVFFDDVPQAAARFKGQNFYQYLKMSERLKLGEENIALMQTGKFDTIFVPQGLPEEISKIPACYELQENVRKVLIYQRNPAASCS